MAWPPSDIGTGNTDAGTDSPQAARTDLLGLMQAFNMLRNHFSAWALGFVEAADAPAARTALGASTVGSNVFTAADAAAARTAIGAAAAAATVNLTGNQTVAGLKTFSDGHLSTSATQPIGYGAGAGAFVTQLTSKSTPVTINRPSGTIFTHTASLAAGASVEFVVNNNTVPTNSIVVVHCTGVSSLYTAITTGANLGQFGVRLTNNGLTRAELVGISFMVFATTQS
jgi:hypothetical protein